MMTFLQMHPYTKHSIFAWSGVLDKGRPDHETLYNVLDIVGIVLVVLSFWALEIAKEYAKQKNNDKNA